MSRRTPAGWKREGTRAIEHKSGKWRISAMKIKDNWNFTLWEKASGDWSLIENYQSIADAVAAAQTGE